MIPPRGPKLVNAHPAQRTYTLFLPAFFLSASVLLNGKPLILLSAPVFRLILPPLVAKSIHHSAMAAKSPDPATLNANDICPVVMYCV